MNAMTKRGFVSKCILVRKTALWTSVFVQKGEHVVRKSGMFQMLKVTQSIAIQVAEFIVFQVEYFQFDQPVEKVPARYTTTIYEKEKSQKVFAYFSWNYIRIVVVCLEV